MHAPRKGRSPSRASSGGKSCSSGRGGSRDESGGSVSAWQGGANGEGVEERKRKREEEGERTGAVRKVPRTETGEIDGTHLCVQEKGTCFLVWNVYGPENDNKGAHWEQVRWKLDYLQTILCVTVYFLFLLPSSDK